MEFRLKEDVWKVLTIFLLFILPLFLILVGVITGYASALYYILMIFWFGMGVVFHDSI